MKIFKLSKILLGELMLLLVWTLRNFLSYANIFLFIVKLTIQKISSKNKLDFKIPVLNAIWGFIEQSCPCYRRLWEKWTVTRVNIWWVNFYSWFVRSFAHRNLAAKSYAHDIKWNILSKRSCMSNLLEFIKYFAVRNSWIFFFLGSRD